MNPQLSKSFGQPKMVAGLPEAMWSAEGRSIRPRAATCTAVGLSAFTLIGVPVALAAKEAPAPPPPGASINVEARKNIDSNKISRVTVNITGGTISRRVSILYPEKMRLVSYDTKSGVKNCQDHKTALLCTPTIKEEEYTLRLGFKQNRGEGYATFSAYMYPYNYRPNWQVSDKFTSNVGELIASRRFN